MESVEAQLKLLMIAGSAGDERAQAALLTGCAARLNVFYAKRLPGRPEDVEDLVQDTLISIHRRRESYDPLLPFTAWLFGIARYKLVDFYRRAGIRRSVSLDEIPDVPHDPETEAVLARIDVEKLLKRLPRRQAEAIQLTRLEGLAVSEASDRSGQSASSIKVGVHRGLHRLALMLQGKER